jgi:hypothetical protein
MIDHGMIPIPPLLLLLRGTISFSSSFLWFDYVFVSLFLWPASKVQRNWGPPSLSCHHSKSEVLEGGCRSYHVSSKATTNEQAPFQAIPPISPGTGSKTKQNKTKLSGFLFMNYGVISGVASSLKYGWMIDYVVSSTTSFVSAAMEVSPVPSLSSELEVSSVPSPGDSRIVSA